MAVQNNIQIPIISFWWMGELALLQVWDCLSAYAACDEPIVRRQNFIFLCGGKEIKKQGIGQRVGLDAVRL